MEDYDTLDELADKLCGNDEVEIEVAEHRTTYYTIKISRSEFRKAGYHIDTFLEDYDLNDLDEYDNSNRWYELSIADESRDDLEELATEWSAEDIAKGMEGIRQM